MRPRRLLLIAAVCSVVVLNVSSRASDDADEPRVTRILHLKDIDSREAVTLLRSEVQVRQIAEIRDLGLLVVKGVAERVDRCESLLRERGAVADAVDPHDPEDPYSAKEGPIGTRVFQVRGIDRRAIVTVLRAIYQMREITELPEEGSVSVRAPTPRLDASEALLKALGVLVEKTEPAAEGVQRE